MPRVSELDASGLPDEVEQTYVSGPGDKRSLEVWKELLAEGKITEEDITEWKDEPWFDMSVGTFQNIEGLDECAELLKTVTELKVERGIDPNLCSQRVDQEKSRRQKRKRELKKLAREPL